METPLIRSSGRRRGWSYSMIALKNEPVASPAGFHQAAVASSATAVNAPAMPCARVPIRSLVCALAAPAQPSTKDTEVTKDAEARRDNARRHGTARRDTKAWHDTKARRDTKAPRGATGRRGTTARRHTRVARDTTTE